MRRAKEQICSATEDHAMNNPPHPNRLNDWFRHFAHHTANAVGHPWSFLIAVLVVITWALRTISQPSSNPRRKSRSAKN